MAVLKAPDELFLLPPTPIAMPRAYWLLDSAKPIRVLSPDVMLVQPSATEFARLQRRVKKAASNEYDLDLINDLYLDSAMVLPHRGYTMLSSEFRGSEEGHALYLGSEDEIWDPATAYDESKLIKFSDWGVPKPWIRMNNEDREEHQPLCVVQSDGSEDCTERLIWNSLYDDYWERQKVSEFFYIRIQWILTKSRKFADHGEGDVLAPRPVALEFYI